MNPHRRLDIPIPDRQNAGRYLAGLLMQYQQRPDVVVLSLPRGGVPIAYEIAIALQVPLDLMLVRKLGVPGCAEVAMGAIAEGGIQVLNDDIIRAQQIDEASLAKVRAQETIELMRRERIYRGDRPALQLHNQQVILVDDGLATGATMQAAVQAVRHQNPARIIVAVPVAAAECLALLRTQVDEIVCPLVPPEMIAIGRWYLNFAQITDEKVVALLREAWQRECRY